MFFSRCLMVVFKTTGGKAWNPPGGLRPLSAPQRRNRRKNTGLTLKNLSILKLAEANQPPVPVRLYKPLNFTRMVWMRKKLEEARQALGPVLATAAVQQQVRRLLPSLREGGGSSSLLPPAAQAARAQQQEQAAR